MLSEGIHSLVDTGNQGLLLYGMKRAKLSPSPEFPFGHGKEVYFWCFIVAMLIFALGGALSIYQGWSHLFDAQAIESVSINYVVLGLAVLFEAGALWVAVKEFNLSRGQLSVVHAIKRGKDPTLFVVVFEDSAAMLGLFDCARWPRGLRGDRQPLMGCSRVHGHRSSFGDHRLVPRD